MNGNRSVAVLIVGIFLAVVTTLFLVVSIGTIRDSIWFSRLITRIERDGVTEERLSEAAEYARRPGDWIEILRIAWRMPDPQRWGNVSEYALTAAERFPRDDSWNLYAVYGLVRSRRYEEARNVLGRIDSPSEVTQKLRVLVALDPDEPAGASQRIGNLADRPEEERISRAIGLAFRDNTADAWFEAAETTGLRMFYLKSALTAAEQGLHAAARRAAAFIRREDLFTGTEPAELYIATWLRDDEWFFSAVSSLGGSFAVQPATILMQTDFLVEQRQWEQVTPLYRELQEGYPGFSPIPYGNDALLQRRTAPFPDDPATRTGIEEAYRQGIASHPEDTQLRLDLAAYFVATGRRFEAVRALIPLGPIETTSADETIQRHWLLARTVLGARTPVERFEADLWNFLNDEPAAHLVARFLARFFLIRNDPRGLSDLRRRYSPDAAPWARTVHAMHAAGEGRFDDAEDLFAGDDSVEGAYNRALFALRHHAFLDSAETLIEELDLRIGETADSGVETYSDLTADAAILSAELARLQGNVAAATEIIDRAVAVNPYSNALYTYRANLARQN